MSGFASTPGDTVKRAGVIGLGDMGSGLAGNLIRSGFATRGYDLSPGRMSAFREAGGEPAGDVAEVGAHADVAFVMVMNGDQAKSVILGEGGLVSSMPAGGAVVLTATVRPAEAREIGAAMEGSGIGFVDSPVSGGFHGAQDGTLTMMAAGRDAALAAAAPCMQAVSKTIHRVGTEAGEGQTVKACLQSLIGGIFAAAFEAAALAAKAGIPGDTIHKVVSTSAAGCGIANTALENIIDRRFEGTGSHIDTMHKDLTIALAMADELGVPMHVAATAMQVFRAGRTKYPCGDNWVCARVIEEIVGAELHR